MDDENAKRRLMVALISFNVTVMILVLSFYFFRGKVGCSGIFISLGVGCVVGGLGYVAAMLTES